MRYRPQLATLVTAPPTGPGWVHELKLDGYRIGALIRHGKAELQSRREIDWTARLKPVAAAAAALPVRSALIDGEVCIVTPDGRTSFQALQNAFDGGPMTGITYYVFDLLELDGEELAALPLVERKVELERLVAAAPADSIVRYSPHFDIDGAELFRRACALGAEGIVSKRAAGKHRPGRSDEWLKAKCLQRQEFVIGGFTEPEGKRQGIGALLLGVYAGDELVFCGKVGTGVGFTAGFLREVRRALEQIEQPECPFATRPPADVARGAHWVRPVLVGEVAFTEWTNEGTLRHPSFQGFRKDKPAFEVTREKPRSLPEAQPRATPTKP